MAPVTVLLLFRTQSRPLPILFRSPDSDDPTSSSTSLAAAVAAGVDDSDADTFRPSRGNVAFGSAHDGWAFRLDQFAAMYADKLGCR